MTVVGSVSGAGYVTTTNKVLLVVTYFVGNSLQVKKIRVDGETGIPYNETDSPAQITFVTDQFIPKISGWLLWLDDDLEEKHVPSISFPKGYLIQHQGKNVNAA